MKQRPINRKSLVRTISVLIATTLLVGVPSPAMAAEYGFTPINYPAATWTAAEGINNAGQIVGEFVDASGWQYGFLLSAGSFTSIRYPGTDTWDTGAGGINNVGQIVGWYSAPGISWGYLYSGGAFSRIIPPDATKSAALAINDSGAIVGNFFDRQGLEHGFLYSGGSYTTIDVPGAATTAALGINNAGQIVGVFRDGAGMRHGFLRSGGADITIDVDGGTNTNALGINNVGEIVGAFTRGVRRYGFLRNTRGGLQDACGSGCELDQRAWHQ